MRRVIKKTISAILACVMIVETYSLVSAQNIKDMDAPVDKEYNNKYVKIIGNGNYDSGISYENGLILISNQSDSSYAEKTNIGNGVSLSIESKLTYVDKDGVDHIIANKDSDGCKKFDVIYGLVTQQYYKYKLVQKSNKVGAIDSNGNIITQNGSQWHDDEYVYDTVDNGYCYGIVDNEKDGVFDFTLLNESGKVLYRMDSCKGVKSIDSRYNRQQNAIFLTLKKEDDNMVVIDFNGSIWSEDEFSNDIIVPFEKENIAVIRYDNSFGYYNYDTHVFYKKEGMIKEMISSDKKYYINNCNEIIVYDKFFNKLFELEGEYGDIRESYGYYILYDANVKYQKVNISDLNGNKWFEEDGKVEETNVGSVIFLTEEGERYFVCDEGKTRYDFENIMRVANDRLYQETGIDIKNFQFMYRTITRDKNILFKYSYADKQYVVVVTKDSDYNDACGVICGEVVYGKEYIVPITKESHIIDTEAADNIKKVNAVGKFDEIYYIEGGSLKCVKNETGKNLYYTNYLEYYYTLDGEKYRLKDNVISRYIYKEWTPFRFSIGSTGYYILAYSDDTYRLYDYNDKEVNIGMDDLYSNPDYSQVCLIRGQFLDGYYVLHYKVNSLDKYVNKVYTYKGEYVFSYDNQERDYIGEAGYIFFVDNKAFMLKNIDIEKLDSINEDSDYIVYDTVNESEVKVISGIKDNQSVKDIEDAFAGIDVSVCDINGRQLGLNEAVGTGSVVNLLKMGKVVDTATVVVKGDTDGSGTINVLDMEEVQKSILGIGEGLAGAYNEAAKLTGNDTVSVLDMEAIQKNILGLEKIN